jgi:universal stress protein E
MRNIRRILVAVKDPAARSLPAVTKAAQLARAFDARLELFHDLDESIYIDTDGGLRELEQAMRARRLAQLEAIAARVRKHRVEVATAAEWDFPAAEAIVRRATSTGADLIVAQCRPGRRLAPWLLRLTDWELLRHSPVPVLLVKNARPYRHPGVLAAIDPAHAHAKPAKLDDEILAAGAAISKALRGRLHAVHAYPSVPLSAIPGDLLDATTAERLEEEAVQEARARFDRALRKTGIPGRRRYLVGQHPQVAIRDAARKSGCAIVAMGAVSRSGLKRLFIGNTAEQLLDEITCDVLVVKPHHFENRVPRAKRGPRLQVPHALTAF